MKVQAGHANSTKKCPIWHFGIKPCCCEATVLTTEPLLLTVLVKFVIKETIKGVAVAQEIKQVVHQLEGQCFDPQLLHCSLKCLWARYWSPVATDVFSERIKKKYIKNDPCLAGEGEDIWSGQRCKEPSTHFSLFELYWNTITFPLITKSLLIQKQRVSITASTQHWEMAMSQKGSKLRSSLPDVCFEIAATHPPLYPYPFPF